LESEKILQKNKTKPKTKSAKENTSEWNKFSKFRESLVIQNLLKVNGVGLPRVVRLNPKTRDKPRR
jgi:hypothetical protein